MMKFDYKRCGYTYTYALRFYAEYTVIISHTLTVGILGCLFSIYPYRLWYIYDYVWFVFTLKCLLCYHAKVARDDFQIR